MPFDALIEPDALAALGITPIPTAVLTEHKRVMRHRMRHHYPAYGWQAYPLDRTCLEAQLKRVHRLKVYGKHLPWRAAAPRKVRRLALRVRDAIPTAEFTLGYLQNDPYLTVIYHGKIACLAIWYTRFRTIAIAKEPRGT